MGSSGCFVQAVIPASASDAPINFRNPRRDTESSHSDAPSGNSRRSMSRNSSLPVSSSRLRQYSGPLVSAILARTLAKSSLFFFPGPTSSRGCLLLFFSILAVNASPKHAALPLAMARVATGDIGHGTHLVFRDQISSQRILIAEAPAIEQNGIVARRLLIPHVEDLLARAKIFLRSAMATQAPLHQQRPVVVHHGHAVDWTMACIAAHALVDVNAVIEINEIGEVVDPRPDQRLVRPAALPHRLQQRSLGPDLSVAIHAGLGGRNPCEPGLLNRGVAVAAINAESCHVVLMAEGNRLRPHHARIRHVGGALNLRRGPEQKGDNEYRSKNCGPRNCISTAMKDLRHRRKLSIEAGTEVPGFRKSRLRHHDECDGAYESL